MSTKPMKKRRAAPRPPPNRTDSQSPLKQLVVWLPAGVSANAILIHPWGHAPWLLRVITEILVLLLIREVLDLQRRPRQQSKTLAAATA
jgi:hypothetical protein